MADRFVILSEYTKLLRHEWEMPEERRISVLRPRGVSVPESDAPEQLVPRCFGSAADYPARLSRLPDETEPVVTEFNYKLRTGPQRWFAINPRFASRLGLSALEGSPFTWIDRRGEVVARTIHWRDGPGRRQPPRFEDVFGEGWLVVLRRDLLGNSIDNRFILHQYIGRSSGTDDGTRTRETSVFRNAEAVSL